MSDMQVTLGATASRAASFVLFSEDVRYHLPKPVSYRLYNGASIIFSGMATTAILVLHDLTPGQAYELHVDGAAPVSFKTENCAGLVDIRDFGADPRSPDNRGAIAEAISNVPDGGTVRVPKGAWTTGPIYLRSRMTLLLEEGAELCAVASRDNWPILPAHDENQAMLGSWEGLPEPCYAGFITGIGLEGVKIIGPGTLDAGGDRGDWWSWAKETREGARRARAIHLINCRDTLLLGPTIRNSPSWTVHPQGCRDLTASGLTITNPPNSPNTDGFNPDSSENIRIEGVFFSVGDDCIAIKSGKRGPGPNGHLRPTRNVDIRHCRMERGHGGVVLGSEMSGGIHEVSVSYCEMFRTDKGLRIKTRRGRGGTVSGVSCRKISMDKVLTAFTANAFYHCDPDGSERWVQSREPAPVDETTPTVEDVRIEDVEVRNVAVAVGAFSGLPEQPIRRISMKGLTVTYDPEAEADAPLMADHIKPVRHGGILFENTELADCTSLPENVPLQKGVSQ